jgi:large subunit ribosomal protein L2
MQKIVKRKPTSPGLRHRVDVFSDHLFRGKPFKSLTKGGVRISGRNNTGKITTRHRGGGNKQRQRLGQDFSNQYSKGLVLRIEYNPKSNHHIGLVRWLDYRIKGQGVGYIIAEKTLQPGDYVYQSPNYLSTGSTYPLGCVNEGAEVYGVELVRGGGPRIARAGGSCCRVLKHDQVKNTTWVELPSGVRRELDSQCLGTLGVSSNPFATYLRGGKAGRNRWKGFRPTVRGEAMNAVDHPHGGNSTGGSQPRTPWGKLAKWIPKK